MTYTPKGISLAMLVLEVFQWDNCDNILWRNDETESDFKFFVLCSDIFEWGTADCEEILLDDIPELTQAKKDMAGLHEDYDWPTLWVARKRGRRPQGAYYKNMSEEAKKLFNDAGPERSIDILNPYTQAYEYKYMRPDGTDNA